MSENYKGGNSCYTKKLSLILCYWVMCIFLIIMLIGLSFLLVGRGGSLLNYAQCQNVAFMIRKIQSYVSSMIGNDYMIA
jgi:hypothetical protein